AGTVRTFWPLRQRTLAAVEARSGAVSGRVVWLTAGLISGGDAHGPAGPVHSKVPCRCGQCAIICHPIHSVGRHSNERRGVQWLVSGSFGEVGEPWSARRWAAPV